MAFFEITQRIVEKQEVMEFYHNHTFFELYFLLDGQKTYYTEKSFYKFSSNCVVISKPNSFHKFEGGPFNRILIAFDQTFLSPFQLNYLSNLSDKSPVLSFSKENFEHIKDTLLSLLKYYNEHVNKNFEKLSMNLYYIIWLIYTQTTKINHYKNDIIDNYNKDYIPNISSVIYKLMQEIDQNYNKSINLNQFSNVYNISKPWLYKHFKEATGLTMLEYKHKIQIEKAKQILNKSNFPINKVANITGFSSTSYFIKIFMKITGTTPLKYRNIVKERK